MTTPAMPTAEEFAAQVVEYLSTIGAVRISLDGSTKDQMCEYLRFVFKRRDRQHAAAPRVSRATRDDLFMLAMKIAGFGVMGSGRWDQLIDEFAAAIGVTYPDSKETTMRDELGNPILAVEATNSTSPRAALSGEISVTGKPMTSESTRQVVEASIDNSKRDGTWAELNRPAADVARERKVEADIAATPPRPDLSKWPEWELTGEYRQARKGDWYLDDSSRPPFIDCADTDHKYVEKSWILRRREAAIINPPQIDTKLIVPPDAAEVKRLLEVFWDESPLQRNLQMRASWVAKGIRAVLAEVRKPVDFLGVCRAYANAAHDADWEGLQSQERSLMARGLRDVLSYARVPIAEPPTRSPSREDDAGKDRRVSDRRWDQL